LRDVCQNLLAKLHLIRRLPEAGCGGTVVGQ
jgi:hypothetical protein